MMTFYLIIAAYFSVGLLITLAYCYVASEINKDLRNPKEAKRGR